MKRILMALVAVLAGLVVPAVADNPTPVQKLAALIVEFEGATKYEAQMSDWSGKRDAWVSAANGATSIAQLKDALVQFENSIKYEAQAAAWKDRRDGWVNEVNRTATLSQLAGLLQEFEASVTWEAMSVAWKNRRDGWLAEVNAAATGSSSNQSGPRSSSPASTSNQNSVSSVEAMFTLESELCQAFQAAHPDGGGLVFDSIRKFIEQLNSIRAAAETAINDGNSVETVRQHTFGDHQILMETLATTFSLFALVDRRLSVERQDSVNTAFQSIEQRAHSATTYSQLSDLLIEMESNIPRDWLPNSWAGRRNAWAAEVRAAFNGTGYSLSSGTTSSSTPSAPTAPTTTSASTGSNAAGWSLSHDLYVKDAQGNEQKPGNPVSGELTGSDVSFSDGTVGDYYYYQAAAGEQVVITMNSPELDGIVFIYSPNSDEVIAQDDDGGGNYNARLAYTFPAEGYYKLLATTTVPGAANRPNNKVYGPYELKVLTNYNYGGQTSSNSTPSSSPASTPANSSAATVTGLAAVITRVLDIDADLLFEAQYSEWTGQRDNWKRQLGNATTLQEVGESLLLLENSMKREYMIYNSWSDRRASWIGEVRNARDAAQLNALTKEFEDAISDSVWDDGWY